jgi:hypothetical protein
MLTFYLHTQVTGKIMDTEIDKLEQVFEENNDVAYSMYGDAKQINVQ